MAKTIKKCPVCGNVSRVKKVSIIWLIFWFMCGVFPAIIYFLIRSKAKCVNCGADM